MRSLVYICLLSFILVACKKDDEIKQHDPEFIQPDSTLLPKRLVIIIVDGPRWEETGGDPTHQYQPYLYDSLKKEGCIFSKFYNLGITYTVPGHVAISTGKYQSISNSGSELPMYPGIPQLFCKAKNASSNKVWLVTGKDKLEVLKNSLDPSWNGSYFCSTDCGVSGLGSGYRNDSITFSHTKNVITNDHPDVLFVQFREPDYSGHANDWPGYLNGIRSGDKYAWELWKMIQSDVYYKDNTLFIVTNDHGRHPNGTLDGFVSHGDGCPGCRHINLFMAGPGIKKNAEIYTMYEQIDIHKTICDLFQLDASHGEGRFIKDAFE